ncbi:kinase-like domain-containing protein [Aspergillus pseudodeflectus]|uniref:Kinase-like domain-containing protein n=1 Tax=Aspergillus pseudodeflectus TaxID=176178 RepID=A0ABR4KVA1_9EURO
MVLSEPPQPTDRSGAGVNQSELHRPRGTTASSDNENHPMTPVSPGRGSFDSAPLSIGHASTDSMHDATHKEHHASAHPLPSLQIRTDFSNPRQLSPHRDAETFVHHSISSNSLPHRTPSLRGLMAGPSHSGGSLSPASYLSSPQLMAMGDITPLPSPIGGASPWRLTTRRDSQSLSRTSSVASRTGSSLSLRPIDPSQVSVSEPRSRGKTPTITDKVSVEKHSDTHTAPKHTRNRSLSEYVPQGRGIPVKPRPVAVSGTGAPQGITSSSSTDSKSNNLHREQYLAVHRGIALPAVRPPSPPRSSGYGASDNDSVIIHPSDAQGAEELYSVRSIRTQQPRLYRKLRQLGHGTFSQVSLAVRVETEENGESGDGPQDAAPAAQKLVAIKVIDHGPAGGADEERLEVSLKREVDILKSLNHPSLVQLKAFGSDEKRALLVLDYCPGGDLFEVVSHNTRPMGPGLIRRIFAELVAAVRYLHEHYVVHRDIKLENVLVNIPSESLQKNADWRTYDRAVVTLSDLGLSRRIPEPPESPLLQTRCGSEDYAAPEILMGQQYDGRSTDGWALGVLLYAMMESRLPFDAVPGTRGDPAKLRARTPHRIARCEWSWYRYADSDGEWDPEKGRDLEGARACVESLLKRNTKRKGLDEIASSEWVKDAIDVPGGLKRGDKEVP